MWLVLWLQGQLGCLRGFTQEMFTAMCVLGGCDYTHDIHINVSVRGRVCGCSVQTRVDLSSPAPPLPPEVK